jgi:hypothetical protein
MAKSGQSVVLLEWNDRIDINVKDTKGNRVLATSPDIVGIHLETNTGSSTLLQVDNLRVKDGRKPVSSQDEHVKEGLEGMDPLTARVAERVIVEQHERLSSETIRVLFIVVGVGMVDPVLLHPEPLASTDKVSAKS